MYKLPEEVCALEVALDDFNGILAEIGEPPTTPEELERAGINILEVEAVAA